MKPYHSEDDALNPSVRYVLCCLFGLESASQLWGQDEKKVIPDVWKDWEAEMWGEVIYVSLKGRLQHEQFIESVGMNQARPHGVHWKCCVLLRFIVREDYSGSKVNLRFQTCY